MSYSETEEITRPDLPTTVARRCKHCGRVYGEHVQSLTPVLRATCGGIRRDFDPEDQADGDRER